MRVDFYQLARDPLGVVLTRLGQRATAGGARMLVVAGDAELRTQIDSQLWSAVPTSFLPHALADSDTLIDEPILIVAAADVVAAQPGDILVLADGRWDDAALGFGRAMLMFDADGIGAARSTWRMLAGRDDVERHFWRQDSKGRWSEVG